MKPEFVLRLYVVKNGPNSNRARANLAAIVRDYLNGNCEIEEVDILKEPERALADRILVTPALVKVHPAPKCCIVGNLSERDKVLSGIGIATASHHEGAIANGV